MKRGIVFGMTTLLITGATIMGASPVQAKPSLKKTFAGYSTFLNKHKKIDIAEDDFYDARFSLDNKNYVNEFVLHDLDGDRRPELITYTPVNFRWNIVRIYTFKTGKVKAYKFSNGSKVVFDNCSTANGYYDFYICNKGHIHNNYAGSFEHFEDVYRVKKGKLKKLSNYTKEDKVKSLKYYKNTKNNRKKLKKSKLVWTKK